MSAKLPLFPENTDQLPLPCEDNGTVVLQSIMFVPPSKIVYSHLILTTTEKFPLVSTYSFHVQCGSF